MSAIESIGIELCKKSNPLKNRFRALFTLKNLGGNKAVEIIASCFDDDSALLKHELAYCLGQMQNNHAVPYLVDVLENVAQDVMVRHEAGEALGAIGDESAVVVLRKYLTDPHKEIAETCQLALERISWMKDKEENLSSNPFESVDPAPPAQVSTVSELKQELLDENLPLFQRYRAMFALRNLKTTEAVLAVAEGLKCSSILFRHEIAFVLGQIQSEASIKQLAENLEDPNENYIVRHECAEALGSIATAETTRILEKYLQDKERVVRESCEVALDITDYENGEDFQYADALSKLKKPQSESITSVS